MNKIVRLFVISIIAFVISMPLRASGQEYIAYPVIFVHGFNANMASWDTTKNNLDYLFKNNYKYGTGRNKWFPDMNYGAAKVGEFSKNGDCTVIAVKDIEGLAPVIYNAIKYLESKGLPDSEQKVILVCHSFGGIIARELLKQNENTLKIKYGPNDSDKIDILPNFFKSHIANVIFVGVPHQGSPLPSLLWTLKEISPKLSKLAEKYSKLNIPALVASEMESSNVIFVNMHNLLLDYKENIDGKIHDAISYELLQFDVDALSIDAYGKAIEQLRLPADVSYEKKFISAGLIETVNGGYLGEKTFLFQENLPAPQKYSTIYSEVKGIYTEWNCATIGGRFLDLAFGLHKLGKDFNFPFGESLDDLDHAGDNVVSSASQRLTAPGISQEFLIDKCHFAILKHYLYVGQGECDQYETILKAIDEKPYFYVVSPDTTTYNSQNAKPLSKNEVSMEIKYHDYLPLNVSIKVWVNNIERTDLSLGRGSLFDMTITSMTVNGKYNAGYSFNINNLQPGKSEILIELKNAAGFTATEICYVDVHPNEAVIKYANKNKNANTIAEPYITVPPGTKAVITKIRPSVGNFGRYVTYVEDYEKEVFLDDKSKLTLQFSLESGPAVQYRVSLQGFTVTPKSDGFYIGKVSVDFSKDSSGLIYVASGQISQDTINTTAEVIIPPGPATSLSLPGFAKDVISKRISDTGALNVLTNMTKAYDYIAKFVPIEDLKMAKGAVDKLSSSLNDVTKYDIIKKKIIVYGKKGDQWDPDKIIQGYASFLVYKNTDCVNAYNPRWGKDTDPDQAFVNGFCPYFSAVVRADNLITVREAYDINGVEQYRDKNVDLSQGFTAKGIQNEIAVAKTLNDLGHFDIISSEIVKNSKNKTVAVNNINDLYELIKDKDFFPANINDIFLEHGLKLKLISVEHTDTTRPKFNWDRNGILDQTLNYKLDIADNKNFNYPIFYQDNIAGTANGIENLDMSQIFTPGLPMGLSAGHYYWRIKVNEPSISNYYSINGEFTIDPWFIVMGGGGGTVPIGGGGGGGTTPVKGKTAGSQQMAVGSKNNVTKQSMVSGNVPGTLEIPAGAVNGEVKINVTPMTTSEQIGDYIVFGQKLYEIYPDEYAFQKSCTIKYNLDGLGTDANGYGIYRYNFQAKDWDFVGADYDPNTKIMSANTSQLGIYGVLRDTKAPEIKNIVDSPDPFSPNGDGANDTTTFNYELNKACNVSIHVVGGDTDVTIAGGLQKTRMNQTIWDGKDNQGKTILDGKYSYTITATDLLGGQTAAGGTTFVFTQKPGTIKGRVLCNGQNVYDARIRMVSSTLETRTDTGGNFELKDVPPSSVSTVNVEVLKKGYFREVFENVSLAAGQTINLGNIDLSNQAIMAHRVTPDEFSPNNDGYKDQLYLNYTLNRKVPITILISSKGIEAYRYIAEKDMGNNITTWDGYESTGKIAKSGYYTYQIYAQAEEENILQAEGTFILNNGLLRNIRCLNELFSPNGDGRDDTCEIAYEMDNNGTVDLKIYNSLNQEIASLMDKVARIPGSYSLEWDGKKQIADGSWQTVEDGQYTYKITSYFEEGMLSNTQTGSITVDQNPPQLSDLTPVNGSHTTNVMPVIRCKISTDQPVSDIENDRLRMKIDDFYVPISYAAATGEIVFAPETSLGVGEHIIVVYAADKAGNEAAPLSNVFYIDSPGADNIKPQIKELTIVGLVQTINGYEVYSGRPSVLAKLFDENSSIDINSITLEIDGERIVNQSKTIDIMHALPAGKVDSATKKNYWLEQWLYTKEILLYNPQTGTLRFNFLDEVADNSNHTVKLQARDISGNLAMEKEFTFKVNIDRLPPTITALTPLNNSTIKATIPMIFCKLADDKSQLDLYSLRFMLDGVEQEVPTNAFNSSNGLLEFKCPLTLEQETQHIITIDISDMAGNKATQAMSVFTVKGDKIAPVIVELTPEDGTLVTNKRPSMTAIVVDNGDSLVDKSSISLEIDGDNISNNNLIIQQDSQKANTVNVSYVPASNLADGQHLLVISAEDDSNNQANPRSAMFRIGDDNVAPLIDQMKPENNATITVVRPLISARLKDDGTGINPSSIVLKIDGDTKQLPEGSYSSATNMLTYVPNIYLTDQAQHVVTIDVKDKAGNNAVRSISIFNVKSLIVGAANVSAIYPEADGFSNKKPTPIKINLISANGTIVPFDNILLSLDSQVRPHVYNVSGGEVKFASDPILPEGLHSIKLNAEDNVGNQINVESSFTMDYTKPVISLTKDIRDGDYVDSLESIDFDVNDNLSGVDENSINVTIDNKKYSGFNYLASANKLALATAEPISDGMHTIELQVSDRATNPSDKKVLKVQIAGELTVEEVVNFPNPFPQEGTKFTCQLSKPANIRIRIYTITGELVKRIETEGQAGYNEFFWDATNDWGRKIAQGAYPYLFEADDGQKKIKIKKTCILKR